MVTVIVTMMAMAMEDMVIAMRRLRRKKLRTKPRMIPKGKVEMKQGLR